MKTEDKLFLVGGVLVLLFPFVFSQIFSSTVGSISGPVLVEREERKSVFDDEKDGGFEKALEERKERWDEEREEQRRSDEAFAEGERVFQENLKKVSEKWAEERRQFAKGFWKEMRKFNEKKKAFLESWRSGP